MNRYFLSKPVYNPDDKLLHEVNPLLLYMVEREILPQPLIVICSNIEQRNRVRRYLKKYCPIHRMTFTWRDVWKNKTSEETRKLVELTDEGTYIFCSDDCPEVEILYEDCGNHSAFQL